jgi:hypothetical protein
VVGTLEIAVWTAARRFGLPGVLALWLLASLLLLGFYAWRLSQVSPWPLPPRMVFVGAFAVLLAFGLAARSIWRSVQTYPPTPLPPLPVALKAAGFWVLGFVGGLLPLLVMDIINLAAV